MLFFGDGKPHDKNLDNEEQRAELTAKAERVKADLSALVEDMPAAAVHSILSTVSARQQLRESLIVRLADETADGSVFATHNGIQVTDNVTQASLVGNARASLYLSPFPSPKVAAVMIYHAFDDNGELYIALVESNRIPIHQSNSPISGYLLPGGNFQTITPKGSEHGTVRVSKFVRDEAEEEISRGNKNAYQQMNSNPTNTHLPLQFDDHHKDLKDCAIHEGIEETGIELEAEKYESTGFVCTKEYTSKSRRIHLMLHYFETDCGRFPTGEALPTLIPHDAHEIKSAFWVKVSELESAQCDLDFAGVNFKISFNNIQLARQHLFGLNKAIKTIRDREIAIITKGILATRENLINAISIGHSRTENNSNVLFGNAPICEFGNYANEYQARMRQLAHLYIQHHMNGSIVSLEQILADDQRLEDLKGKTHGRY